MRERKRQGKNDGHSAPDRSDNDKHDVQPLADRVRSAMKAGLQAITADEIAKIDGQFGVAQRLLLATYSDFPVDSIPADLGAVLRDLRVYRDRQVDELTFRVAEDFRMAMRLVEWAIEERGRPATYDDEPGFAPDLDACEAVDDTEPHGETNDVDIHPADQMDASRDKTVDVDALVRGDGASDGLTSEQRMAILRMIAPSPVPVRTAKIALDMRADAKTRRGMLRFLKRAQVAGAVVLAGNTFGRSVTATKALKAALQ